MKQSRVTLNLEPPVKGREAAARRWMVALWIALGLGLACGALVAVSFVEVALVGVGLFVLAVLTGFACGVGIGWTRGMPWHRSLWMAFAWAAWMGRSSV